MPQTHLSSKGQLTLPKEIRDYLKVNTGDLIAFTVEPNGQVTVTAVTAPVTSLKGLVRPPASPVSVEDMNSAIRGRAHSR